jgi:hypothetical protein
MLAAGAWKWRLKNAEPVRRELFQCFTFLAADEELGLPREHREFYAGLASAYSGA